jgi:hemoglobin-like flavoprotein
MSNREYQLVESSIGQMERCGRRFTENFAREIDQMSSLSPTLVPSQVQIDPLQFMHLARDRYRALEACEILAAPSLLPDAEQFNLAANAMLRAMTATLGPELDPGTREAWISALRLIAEREPVRT